MAFEFPEPIELKKKLKDILEPVVEEKFYLSDEQVASFKFNTPSVSYCLDASYSKGTNLEQYIKKGRRQLVGGVVGKVEAINGHDILKRVYGTDGYSPTLSTMGGGNREPKILASRGRGEPPVQHLEPRKDSLTNTITSVAKDNYLAEPHGGGSK